MTNREYRRVTILETDLVVEDIFSGEYILVTVKSYNSIVRQLNLLKLLIKEALPLEARENNPIYDKLFSTNNEVVE